MSGQIVNPPAGPRLTRWQRSRSLLPLIAGFGALLVLMAFICIDSLYTLRTFEANNTQIRQDFLYRERTLDQVRASLYESGNIIGDVAVEADAHVREMLRAELLSIESQTTSALIACIQSLPVATKDPFQHLAAEMEGYWATVNPIFASEPKQQERRDGSVLRGELLAQHARVVTITRELSALNSQDLNEAERRIEEVSAQFRRRFLTVATVGLSFGLILAAATIGYAGRLENRLAEKYEASLRAQQELRELSKRLVDAEERERRAISRELHDEVGQSLSALLLDVQNLLEISTAESALHVGLHHIKTSAENCLEEVRNMALLLRPSMLDDLGLVAALEWQAREVSKRTGMIVEVIEENVSDHLPEEHKTCVYRVVQEALNNSSKHAYAKNVRVTLRQEQNHLRVSIEDDGKGFDPRRVRGLGLVGMNERVTQLSGVLTVDSDPARG